MESEKSRTPGGSGSTRAAVIGCALLLGVGGIGFALGRGGFLGWVFAGFLLLGARFWLRPGPRDAQVLVKAIIGVVAAIVLLFLGMVGSWETAEVMVLRQRDADGEWFQTRLWVIDLRGYPSFAAASPDVHERVGLLQRFPEVEFSRGGETDCARAVIVSLDRDLGEEARRLYEEKYGFRIEIASKLIGFLLGGQSRPEDGVIVRLEPCPGEAWDGSQLPLRGTQ